MDKIRAQRKKYDLFWDIDPIDVTCNLVECIDLLELVSQYMEHESSDQPFTPILRLTEKRSTRAQFDIIDRSHGLPYNAIGAIEVILTGKGSRITFQPDIKRDNESAVRYYRGLYRVVLNDLSRHDVLHDPNLPGRFVNEFEDVPFVGAGNGQQSTRVDQTAIRLLANNTTIERVAAFILDFSTEYQLADHQVGVEKSFGGDGTLFDLYFYLRHPLTDEEKIRHGIPSHTQNAETYDNQKCGTIRIKAGIVIGQVVLECNPLTVAARQFVDALADRLRADQQDTRPADTIVEVMMHKDMIIDNADAETVAHWIAAKLTEVQWYNELSSTETFATENMELLEPSHETWGYLIRLHGRIERHTPRKGSLGLESMVLVQGMRQELDVMRCEIRQGGGTRSQVVIDCEQVVYNPVQWLIDELRLMFRIVQEDGKPVETQSETPISGNRRQGGKQNKGGRPSYVEDEWATNELEQGRPRDEVVKEWLEKTKISGRKFADFQESFDKQTSAVKKRRERTAKTE